MEYSCNKFVSVLIATLILNQIKALHLYDCLRANKSTSAWGVEARVPFLDKEFINVAMAIDPEWKMVSMRLLCYTPFPTQCFFFEKKIYPFPNTMFFF